MRNSRLLPALSLLGCVTGCHKAKPPPSIDALTAVLQRSAEQTLTVPSLANEQVILSAPVGKIDAEAAEVLQAASAAGGVAIRSVNSQGQVSILATIPENNADAFKAALRNEKAPMERPSSSTRLIEILIQTASASPAP